MSNEYCLETQHLDSDKACKKSRLLACINTRNQFNIIEDLVHKSQIISD
jgi:hypothetical protein